MSTVIVVAPILVASWPAISAAVTAAVGTLGFALAKSGEIENTVSNSNRTEIEVEDSEILQATAGKEQKIVVERDGMRATFSRDARGALKLCMEGRASKDQLRKAGEELMGRVTQQYAYHRIVTELKQRNMTILDEELSADQTVKIRVRSF